MEQGVDYEKEGGALLVFAWIFAVLGGLLGIILSLGVIKGNVTLEDGSIHHKYNEKARTSAKFALGVSIAMIVLGYAIQIAAA